MYKKTKLHPDTGYKNGEDETGEYRLPPDYQAHIDKPTSKYYPILQPAIRWFKRVLKLKSKIIFGIIFVLFTYNFYYHTEFGGTKDTVITFVKDPVSNEYVRKN